MYLESDAFTISYDPDQCSVAAIMKKIRGLGYQPEEGQLPKAEDVSESQEKKPIPEPVAAVLAEASDKDNLFLLDFHAKWCLPCKKLEAEVLSDPKVKEILKTVGLIKVDTDRFPKAAEYYNIKALPTLLVLDGLGGERFRHVGPITVEALIRDVENLDKSDEE